MSRLRSPSTIDLLAAVGALADAHLLQLAVVLALVDADPRRPLADRADDHHVRDLDRRRLVDDAARNDLRAAHPVRVAHRTRARMPLDDVQVLDDHAALLRARV